MRCDAYGAETGGAVPFGGFLPNPVAVQPICKAQAVHRFTWVCDCGHKGKPISLCEWHYGEFNGEKSARFDCGEGVHREHNGHVMPVPWNIRRDVQSCPRCASLAPSPEQQHKCRVRLVTVS